MQKSIMETEEQFQKKVAQKEEQKIPVVHQHLDIIVIWFLARPTPTIDLTTLLEAVANLQADNDRILEKRGPMPETEIVELVEETMFDALFTAPHCTATWAMRPCQEALSQVHHWGW